MPEGFNSSDLAKPPGRRELARIDKEWRALEIWCATTDLKAVRDQMKLGSQAQAQVLVNRGLERWQEYRSTYTDALRVRHTKILDEMIGSLADEMRKGKLGHSRDLKALMDRQAQLMALDEQREQQQTGPQIVVNVGLPELNDARVQPDQFERPALSDPNVIDGEVVE
jgi:hypothetical protein